MSALRNRLNARIARTTTPFDGLKAILPDPKPLPYSHNQLADLGLAGESQVTWAPSPAR
jgi:hypothetical protein